MPTLASSTSLVPQSSRACAKSSSIQACSFSGLRPVRNSPCFTIKNAPAMTDRCIGCPKRASALCVETMPHPTGNKEKDKAFADCDAYPTGGISHPHSGGLLGSPSDTIARLCRLGRCCFIACRTHGIRIGCIIKQELARIPCMSPGGLCCLRRLFLGRTSLVFLQHTIKVRLQVVTAAETNRDTACSRGVGG